MHKEQPFHDGLEQIWSDQPSLLTPFHYRDGVTVYLARTDESPEDDFLDQGGDGVFGRTAPAD